MRSTVFFSISCAGRCIGRSSCVQGGTGRPIPALMPRHSLPLWQRVVSASLIHRSTAECAAWILRHSAKEWVDFKCRVITDFVAEARDTLNRARATARLGAFLVPDGAVASEPLTGQRWEALAPLLDWASPMLYHNILLQPADWIGAMVDKAVRVMGRKTLPVIQADSSRDPTATGDWGPPMDDAGWQVALAEVVGRSDIAGFIVFPGPSLLESARGQTLSNMLEGR